MLLSKVVIVLNHLELGGAERQAIYLAEFLDKNPMTTVEVIGFKSPGKVSQYLTERNIPWKRIPLELSLKRRSILKNAFILSRYLRKTNPNAVIPFTYWPNLLCGLLRPFTGVKVCIWNQRDEGRAIRGVRLEKLALRNVSHIVSNSREGKLFLERKFNIPSAKIKIIHNGVNPMTPKNDVDWWHQRLKINANTFIVLMVANLHAYKDHATLLRSWKLFTGTLKSNNAMLLLAGRLDNTHHYLKALAYDLNLYESIRFLGEVQDVSGLLAVADLVALSSKKEGCPNSVLEAMRFGKPVVATDIIGNREALGDHYAYLAKPDNAEDLCQKIRLFYDQPDLRAQVGQENEVRVRNAFSMENMQNSYLKLVMSS